MKLDQQLLLLLLLQLEGQKDIDLSAYDEETILYHQSKAIEVGYAKGKVLRGDDTIKTVHLSELTREGHQAISANRYGAESDVPQTRTIPIPKFPAHSDHAIKLTEEQVELLRWIDRIVRTGEINSEFLITWSTGAPLIARFEGSYPAYSTESNFRVLHEARYLLLTQVGKDSYKCIITQAGKEIVDEQQRVQGQSVITNNGLFWVTENQHLVKLAKFVASHCNLEDIRNLCFELDVDYEELDGSTKSSKARALVQHMAHRQRLDELRAKLHAEFGQGYENHFH